MGRRGWVVDERKMKALRKKAVVFAFVPGNSTEDMRATPKDTKDTEDSHYVIGRELLTRLTDDQWEV